MMDRRSKSSSNKSVDRKAVFDSDYEDVDERDVDVKQERNVHYGTHDEHSRKRYRKFNRLRGRIGRPNSERQRHSYWDDDREERHRRDDRRRGNYGYEWDKTFKRTDPRQWKRSRRDRYNRRHNDGHPLDPLKYHQEDRIVHFTRHRGGNYNRNYRNHRHHHHRHNQQNHHRYNYRRYHRRSVKNNNSGRQPQERHERRSLDNDLDSYFSTSERHSRKRLDTDLDGYMNKTKKGLDRTIDLYMSDAANTKKVIKSVIKKADKIE